MRVLSRVLISAVVLACQPQAEPLLNTDKTAMRAVTDSFTAYVVTHRDSMAAAQYAESATLMPPNHGVVQGRAAIRAFIAAFPPLSHFTASPIEIDGRADLASVRGTYQMTFASPPGRPAIEDHAKFLEIRRRRTDGQWCVVADVFHSDQPAKPERERDSPDQPLA